MKIAGDAVRAVRRKGCDFQFIVAIVIFVKFVRFEVFTVVAKKALFVKFVACG
jgi:hypothetical protein